MTDNQEEIRANYRALALEWDAARADPKKANRLFKKHHALYKEVRDTETGRLAITSLLKDPQPAVRLLAATHCLPLQLDEAVAVLEALEAGAGTYAMDAKYTLINFRTGRLNLDW